MTCGGGRDGTRQGTKDLRLLSLPQVNEPQA